MRRREFLGTAIGAALMQSGALASVFPGEKAEVLVASSAPIATAVAAATKQAGVAPMAIGVMIGPSYDHPEAAIARVKELGMSNCFLNLDDYIGRFSPAAADQLDGILKKH
ncbi:MAG: hypothetical protein V4587_11355, partial [Acidobacteriota bacterium]